MQLIAYTVMENGPMIRPAPHERQWMDRTRDKYAYRCLPLVAANSHGWELLCPFDLTASWNGGPGKESIVVVGHERARTLALSHFGHGILTFDVGYIFRTEPNVNLWVTGPANMPKDGIAPLSGLVETDWSPYTFTMNWLFTRPCMVSFSRGEPFCFFFPVGRGVVDDCEPKIVNIHADPELAGLYETWRDGRKDFLVDLNVAGSAAQEAKWQRTYFRGYRPDGRQGIDEHQTRVRPKPFVPAK